MILSFNFISISFFFIMFLDLRRYRDNANGDNQTIDFDTNITVILITNIDNVMLY